MAGLGKIFGRGVAVAAAAAALAAAAPAGATSYVKLISDTMNFDYHATITGDGEVIANGVKFLAIDTDVDGNPLADAAAYDIFGFCVDVFHNITAPATLGYVYTSNKELSTTNPLPYDFGGTTIEHVVGDDQLLAIKNLVNTGYQLHADETDANRADTEMRLAAIQAAIWSVEVPSKTVGVVHTSNMDDTQFGRYSTYFSDYSTGHYAPLGATTDRFYVISDGTHQSFASGWPIDVPEPATWGLMIMGFGGIGSVLRRRRSATAVA